MCDHILKIILTPVGKRLNYWYNIKITPKIKTAISIDENIELIKEINKASLEPDENEKLLASKIKLKHLKMVKGSGK